jgi:hypothetical protein
VVSGLTHVYTSLEKQWDSWMIPWSVKITGLPFELPIEGRPMQDQDSSTMKPKTLSPQVGKLCGSEDRAGAHVAKQNEALEAAI